VKSHKENRHHTLFHLKFKLSFLAGSYHPGNITTFDEVPLIGAGIKVKSTKQLVFIKEHTLPSLFHNA